MSETTRIRSHVALLRGLNVGGKNRLRMTELKALFRSAGCPGARTYIQSGNVVFRIPQARMQHVTDAVRAELARTLGREIPIVLRTGEELARVVDSNPFLAATGDSRALHVGFLPDVPVENRRSRLDQDRSPPDEFAIRGREIYLCLPNGVARTKLTNTYFDKVLGLPSTFRNWRTVRKLAEMSRS